MFVSLTVEQEALALPKRAVTLKNDAPVYTSNPRSVTPPGAVLPYLYSSPFERIMYTPLQHLYDVHNESTMVINNSYFAVLCYGVSDSHETVLASLLDWRHSQ